MRYIERLPKPEILEKKEEEWLEKFLEKRKTNKSARPDNSKYAHKEILTLLEGMSKHKCFYCETKLKRHPSEVEHHIEIQCDETLAFDWNNLNLSCKGCNGKLTHTVIPITSALLPCTDSDEVIEKHIDFEDEQITFLTGKGNKTIEKYKLDRESLDLLRSRALIQFYKKLDNLKNLAMKQGRNKLSETELNILRRFARTDYPFSLMFKILLKKKGLL